MYVPNNRVSKCRKQKRIDLKGETEQPTTVTRYFNTLLSANDIMSRKKKKKNIDEITLLTNLT